MGLTRASPAPEMYVQEARKDPLYARSGLGTDWAAVYETSYEDLVRFLYRMVWEEDRAHDLAQETFVRALRHDPDEPRAWLYSVARNLARDEARSVVRRRRHLALIRVEESDRVAEDAEQEMEREERRHAVRVALERLSERDREVLLLWDAGLSYDEIAEQTDLARGAIGTTLSRARRRLVQAHRTREDHDATYL
ncbi:MAG: sigma-70 family RNA polymerase sigma factor [Gemmatimonadetes bacterium]|nr:sigma-70 family RNA polymerase sigma factor [Gemmatimonadota bacterium]